MIKDKGTCAIFLQNLWWINYYRNNVRCRKQQERFASRDALLWVEDGCRSGRFEGLRAQHASHLSLGSQYWFTRIYIRAHECETHTTPGHRPGIERLRVVDEYTDRIPAEIPRVDSSENATFVLYIVLTHLFVARFIFQRYRISSLKGRFLDYLVRNYAKRQNRFQRRFIIRISRLIFPIIPWFFVLRFTKIRNRMGV